MWRWHKNTPDGVVVNLPSTFAELCNKLVNSSILSASKLFSCSVDFSWETSVTRLSWITEARVPDSRTNFPRISRSALPKICLKGLYKKECQRSSDNGTNRVKSRTKRTSSALCAPTYWAYMARNELSDGLQQPFCKIWIFFLLCAKRQRIT